MTEKHIIVFTGPEGSGRTTLAKIFAGYHSGEYYSLHSAISSLLEKKYKRIPKERDAFTQLANKFRKTKKDGAIAVKKIVKDILANKTASLHIVDSVQCVAEMDYIEEKCMHKATVTFVGLLAPADQRVHWINRNPEFESITISAASLNAKEFRIQAFAGEFEADVEACLDRIPPEFIFQNEAPGKLTALYLEIRNAVVVKMSSNQKIPA